MTPAPVVTVAIPTRDRHVLLADAIASVLAQTYPRFVLLILDNSTNDLTDRLVRSYSDSRIEYVRAVDAPDVIACWNQCVSLCRTPYLHIFSDDDRLHPTFLQRSLDFHEAHPTIAFTFTHAYKADAQLRPVRLWGYEFPPSGILSGSQYLEFTFTHACCITLAPTVVIRSAVHEAIGSYRGDYARNTFDLAFYLRVALRYDVGFIDEPLVDYRLHSGQLTALHWREPTLPTGKIGTLLDLLGVLDLWEASDTPPLQAFACERRAFLLRELTQHLKGVIPGL